jgi:hypothetical protein
LHAVLAVSAVGVVDDELLLRTVEVYEAHRLDFADAYLVANAERTGIDEVVSVDRAIDRVGTVRRSNPRNPVGSKPRLREPSMEPLWLSFHAPQASPGSCF